MQRIEAIILLIIFLSIPTLADEGSRLHGILRDGDRLPLPGVIIKAEGRTKKSTITNQNGRYEMRLPKGEYLISVQSMNFKKLEKRIHLTGDTELDLVLEDETVLLNEVNVYAEASQQVIQRKSFSAISLDIAPITASLVNLGTLINKGSGMRLRESGGVGSDFNLTINGLGGNAVQYFVDGVPLASMGSGVSIANIPVNLVEKVEIYKGVVPTELGMDALGGAINIITKRKNNNYLDLSLGGGSFHNYDLNASGQYVLGNSGLTFRPAFSYSSSKNNYTMRDIEIWDEEQQEYVLKDLPRFHDAYRSILGQMEMGFTNRHWADDAFVGVSYSKVYKEIQTGVQQKVVVGEAHRDRDALRVLARYSKQNLLLDGLSLSAHLSYTNDHTILTDTCFRSYEWDGSYVPRPYSEVTGRGKSIRHTERPTLVGRTHLSYKPTDYNSLALTYSLNSMGNHRYDDFDREFLESNDQLSKHIFGLAYNHSFWEDKLLANLFLKDYLYHVKVNQTETPWITGADDVPPKATKNYLGYGMGSRYSFSSALALKISYEHAVRLPTARELLGNGETVYANLKLKPEQANNLNLSAYGNAQLGSGHTLRYESNLFMRKVTNYIIRTIIDERQSQFENIGAATVMGGELEVSYEYARLFNLTLNATYLEERNKTPLNSLGHPNITYNNRMPNRPYFYGNAMASGNIRTPFGLKDHRLKLDLSYNYIHWFFLTWEAYGTKESKATIPTQHVLDSAVTWFFPSDKYSISIQGSNLLNHRLYDNYMLQKPGRAVYCKFQIFI